MPYTKKTYVNGDILSVADMNNLIEGIDDAKDTAKKVVSTAKTQPTDENNKLWITEEGVDYVIPDMTEYQTMMDRVEEIQGDLTQFANSKIDKPTRSDNNKIPRAKDGNVEWVDVGQPTDSQTASAVTSWLNAHPEATTTVQDRSLTIDKMVVGTLGYVTPKIFGSKNNWASNPASKYFSTIEELKIVYPMAQSLDDEMDLLAVEYAVTNYNNILLPAGGYFFNRTIVIPAGRKIEGVGAAKTQITYTGTTAPAFIVDDYVSLKGFKITHKSTTGVRGTTSEATCVSANGTNRGIYEGVQIVGFNYGIYFFRNSWCNYVNNCHFNYCNTAIYGEEEFNAVIISQSAFTYNTTGVRAGHGRSLIVENCTFERNNDGIRKFNKGDITISGCYFELHDNSSVSLSYASYPVDLITVTNCSFYTTKTDEVFIRLTGNANTIVNIEKNIFECAKSVLNGNTIKCINSTTNGLDFNIDNNFLADGCEIGIDDKYINGFTENGKNIVYNGTSNLSNAFNNGVNTIRFEFVNNGTITLPDLSSSKDTSVRKFVAYWTGSSDYSADANMIIDETGKTVVGEKKIKPNTMYSIYYQGSRYLIFK